MKFKKLSSMLITTTATMMILQEVCTETYLMNWKMMTLMKSLMNNFELAISINKWTIMFLMMVMTVTSLISFYGELYMEEYNNKKFFYFMLLFLSSMMILVSSASMLNTMVGWELLGISSLMLIMFYPNKTGKVNSIMTMMFNRMGDVIMIMSMGLMMMNMNIIMNTNSKLEEMSWVIVLMMICMMTKSAQFPMSAWLPAAMSAPTPISAMVHSSTLVTAGIFLMMKMNKTIMNTNMIEIMVISSSLSFLAGGMMANSEKDYKKMIAFSTMSQISLIMLMASMQMMNLSLMHMMNHALFKTLVFCSSGMIFMTILGNQMKSKINEMKSNKMMKLMTFTSLFSMTGLMMSSSFQTKDMMLETISTKKDSTKMILMLMGSILTLLYCCQLMKSTITNMSNSSKKMSKNFTMFYLKTFIMMTVIIMTLPKSKSMFWKMETPMTSMEMSLLMIMLTLPLLFKIQMKSLKTMTKTVATMKLTMYTLASKMMKSNMMKETTLSEMLTLKAFILKKSIKMKTKSWFILATMMALTKMSM